MGSRRARQAVVTGVSFAIGIAPVHGNAQPVPSAASGAALPPSADDPPARVGRVAQLSGTVSFHLAGADQWEPAALNLPVTTGNAFWTEPGARAEVDATGVRFGMDQSTELDVTELDNQTFTAALPQGTACVHVPMQPPGTTTSVQTPRSQVTFTQPGRYEVAAGDAQRPTIVTVVEGAAETTGSNVQAQAGPNQSIAISGDGQAAPFQATVAAAERDAFLSACIAADRPTRPRTVQVPAVVQRMTGGSVLDDVGDWSSTPNYGPIWYPPAEAGFVPYRQGRWGYVAPWGWTWIDDAPWGFAPTHYGRWVEVEDRWGWIPGGESSYGDQAVAGPAFPTYAPAVVSFLAGAALGAVLGRAFGGGRGGGNLGTLGWVPLGPQEPYYPPYRVSDTYVRNLNATHVQNVTNVVNNYRAVVNQTTNNNFGNRLGAAPGASSVPVGAPLVNRAGATAVPAAVMASSRPVAAAAQPVPEAAFAHAVRIVPRPPVAPTRATVGVTPAVAREFNIPARAPGPSAPGPVLRPGQPGVPREPGQAPGPADLGAGAVGGAPVNTPQRPGVPGAALGLPGLRAPGGPAGLRPNGGAPGPAIGPAAEQRLQAAPQRPGLPSPSPQGEPSRGAHTLGPPVARPEVARLPAVVHPAAPPHAALPPPRAAEPRPPESRPAEPMRSAPPARQPASPPHVVGSPPPRLAPLPRPAAPPHPGPPFHPAAPPPRPASSSPRPAPGGQPHKPEHS